MSNRPVLVLTLLCLLGCVVTMSSATCIPARNLGTFNFVEGRYYYLHFGVFSGAPPARFDAYFYEPGNRAGANQGTLPFGEWLMEYYAGPDDWYIYGTMTDPRVVGCPVGQLVVEAWAREGVADSMSRSFVKLTVDETLDSFITFDYSRCLSNIESVPAPVYRISASNRDGDLLKLSGFVSSAAAGENDCGGGHAPVARINVYTIAWDGIDPPTEIDVGWQLVSDLPPEGGSLNLDVDCSDRTTDTFIGTGLVVAGEAPLNIAAPTRAECDPTVADPRIQIRDGASRQNRLPRADL